MSDKTNISWTDATWNPIRGCSRVSEGCRHCYAEKVAARFNGPGMPYEGLAKRVNGEARWTGKVDLVEAHLLDPLRWRKPRRIFVNSMSDLFHEKVPDEWIDRIFAVMALAPQHTFQVLTKRPERMREYMTMNLAARAGGWCRHDKVRNRASDLSRLRGKLETLAPGVDLNVWPLPNAWLGVSCEDQATADERIPILLDTPAAVRFVSAEPLLGPTDLMVWENKGHDLPSIDWVIVGGESGTGARPCHVAWMESILAECKSADVACFVKQLGSDPRWVDAKTLPIEHAFGKNDDPARWPEPLRVQQFPLAARIGVVEKPYRHLGDCKELERM